VDAGVALIRPEPCRHDELRRRFLRFDQIAELESTIIPMPFR
jgi:hypothetical protein